MPDWPKTVLHPGRRKPSTSYTNPDPDAKASLERYKGSAPAGYSHFLHDLGGPHPDYPESLRSLHHHEDDERLSYAKGGPVLPRSGPTDHTTLFKRK